jgi:hypothetical protein
MSFPVFKEPTARCHGAADRVFDEGYDLRINRTDVHVVGLSLRPTELLIFGNAKGGTPLMQATQSTY